MKYPRTPHVCWSSNREDDDKVLGAGQSLALLASDGLVIEEKIDGANCCIHFENERLILRSRGDELRGGDHPQWHLLKSWSASRAEELYIVLGDRFAMWGEWMYAEHNLWYNALPHYFLEFDVLDKETGTWLDTDARRALVGPAGIVSVPVIHRGPIKADALEQLVHRPSVFGAHHRPNREASTAYATAPAEGVYLKLEAGGKTIGRAKWVRGDFVRQIISSEHWSKMPVTPNLLAKGVNIYG